MPGGRPGRRSEGTPRDAGIARGRRGHPHGWNSLDNYLKTHDGYLTYWERVGFLLEDALEWRIEEDEDRIVVRGRLVFLGGYSIAVDKVLGVRFARGRREVRTIRYAYQALRAMPDGQVRELFRYDNDHRYVREGHPDEHHEHVFDSKGRERVIWVGRENWPTLHQVIERLFALALQINDTLWQ